MGEKGRNNKVKRVLGIYTKLLEGDFIYKEKEAQRYGVNKRSIQRDIDDIRNFLESDLEKHGCINPIVYDRKENGYRMKQIWDSKFTNSEILAVCKILLDSRAFIKKEMETLLKKLISCGVPKDKQIWIEDLIKNEFFHYVELHHKKSFMNEMWNIGEAIRSCNFIEIEYCKKKGMVKRKLKPAAIIFSEYYFYLTAFIDDENIQKCFDVSDDPYPTIYRMDRIKKVKVLNEKFHIPYSSRFQEGEFRKRIQFMYGGKLQRVKFRYKGENVEAILDRLPTAEILSEENGVYLIHAEVFGKGIDMWLRSQGDMIERI